MKKQISSYRVPTLLFLLMALAAVSCKYKPLTYEESFTSHVKVVFDWKYVTDPKAESMDLWLYPEKGGTPIYYQFAGRDGGVISVPDGKYRAVFANADSEIYGHKNTEVWEGFEMYSSIIEDEAMRARRLRMYSSQLWVTIARTLTDGEESSSSEDRAAKLVVKDAKTRQAETNPYDENIIRPGDKLYTGVDLSVDINPHQKRNNLQTLTLYPHNRLRTYTVRIHHVKNRASGGALSGTLSGMSGSYFPALERYAPDRNIVGFPFVTDPETSDVTSVFQTLGASDHENNKRQLVVYATLTDGRKWYEVIDVTDIVEAEIAKDPFNVVIDIDTVTLPYPIFNEEGGLSITVDDWKEEIHHINF